MLVSDVQQLPVATAWPYLARESMVVKKDRGIGKKNMKISGYLEKSMKISGSLEIFWNLWISVGDFSKENPTKNMED